MHDVVGKLLGKITSIYFSSLAHVRVKRDESKQFMINRGIRQGCIMSPWLFNVYMDAVMKEVKMVMERKGIRFLKEEIESKLPGFFYADDLFLYG